MDFDFSTLFNVILLMIFDDKKKSEKQITVEPAKNSGTEIPISKPVLEFGEKPTSLENWIDVAKTITPDLRERSGLSWLSSLSSSASTSSSSSSDWNVAQQSWIINTESALGKAFSKVINHFRQQNPKQSDCLEVMKKKAYGE